MYQDLVGKQIEVGSFVAICNIGNNRTPTVGLVTKLKDNRVYFDYIELEMYSHLVYLKKLEKNKILVFLNQAKTICFSITMKNKNTGSFNRLVVVDPPKDIQNLFDIVSRKDFEEFSKYDPKFIEDYFYRYSDFKGVNNVIHQYQVS